MPLYWIEVETAEVINSGWLQNAQSTVQEAVNGLVATGAAAAGLIVGGILNLWGSRDQGASFPTQVTYQLSDGTPFTMSFAWSCSWNPGGGDSYPPNY